MADTENTAQTPETDPVYPSLDFEMLRAQIVNAVLYANQLFQDNNPGLESHLGLSRIADMGVLFTVGTNAYGERLYLFRLINPDGTQARLSRLDPGNWEELEADAVDQAFKEALGKSLIPTVCAAYGRMVPLAARPTHETTTTLQ